MNNQINGVFSYTRARIGMLAAVTALLAVLLLPGVVAAQTQGYNTSDKSITKAMAVSVAESQTEGSQIVMVEKSTINRADKVLGVVVDPASELVTVTSQGSQIYVANSGIATVFVTDVNGMVREGDLLAPSPLAGVLMRATEGTKGVMGIALEDMSSDTQTVTVKNDAGQEVNTKVGQVQINMDVKFSSNAQGGGKSLLQRIGEAIVRRPVSTTQVVVAMIILSVLLFVEGAIIYGAISSSIISLGRNPLAKRTILRGLGQISILVFVVLTIGLGAVYLVLWV